MAYEKIGSLTSEQLFKSHRALVEMTFDVFSWTLETITLTYPYMINKMSVEYHSHLLTRLKALIVVDRQSIETAKIGHVDLKYRQKMADLKRVDIHFRESAGVPQLCGEHLLLKDCPVFFEDHYVEPEVVNCSFTLSNGVEFKNRHSERAAEIAENDDREIAQNELPVDVEVFNINYDTEMDEDIQIMTIPSMSIGQNQSISDHSFEQDIHVVILVHGYQASSFDTAFLKAHLHFLLGENVKMICSTSNDIDSTKSIAVMSKNLVGEVRSILTGFRSFSK